MYEKKTDEEDLEITNVTNKQNVDFENLKSETVLADIKMSVPIEEEPMANVSPFDELPVADGTPLVVKDDIFKTTGKVAEMRLWGDILLEVKQSGDNILGAICETVEKTKINGENFEIYMRANGFDDVEYYNKMQNIVKQIANLNLKVYSQGKEKSEKAQDIEYLKQKFGEKLSII